MNPREAQTLRIGVDGLRVATAKLIRSTKPTATRVVELPRIIGGPVQGDAIAADEALELTLGALASAHRQLTTYGLGLARTEPLRTRLAGELAGVEVSAGRAWLRLDMKGTR